MGPAYRPKWLQHQPVALLRLRPPRAISSAGRAPPRQGGGHWFEPSIAHLTEAPQMAGFSAFWGPVRRSNSGPFSVPTSPPYTPSRGHERARGALRSARGFPPGRNRVRLGVAATPRPPRSNALAPGVRTAWLTLEDTRHAWGAAYRREPAARRVAAVEMIAA